MTRSWDFPSSSSSKIYTTQVNSATGLLSCNCPGWVVKKLNQVRSCKHTKKVIVDEGLVVEVRDDQQFVMSATQSASGWNTAAKIREQVVAENKAAIDILAKDDGPNSKVRPSSERTRGNEPIVPFGTVKDFISPMLASKMPDGLDADFYATDDYVMEEKYDGHRIIIRNYAGVLTTWSRLGNVRTLPAHIAKVMKEMPAGVYDGELLVPGMHSYDVTAGQNSGQEVLVLFDILEINGTSIMNEPLAVRHEFLTTAYGIFEGDEPYALFIAPQMAPSTAKVKFIWGRGGEGTVIKRLGAKYSPGWRTPDWIKCKQELAATLVITGFKTGKSGPYSTVELVDDQGNKTSVKTLDNDTLRAIAKDPDSYIGKRLVISYHERTPSGNYRHPMFDHLAGVGE